ncbi:MAG TPA: hypothetical protein VKA89_05650 [Solirubrobacterales bacterium]|nr:hypothetical protein [Solirubrobacterales bacterium]
MRSVWISHAGSAPREVETTIRANTVICTMTGGTVEFSEGMIEARVAPDGPSSSDYRADAVAAVVGVTGQRVKFLLSKSDPAADVATELFTLEESLRRGRPRESGTPSERST